MKEENDNKIIELYESGKSPYEIARELNTYPNKIRRTLIKEGKTIRTRGEAQSLALKNGTREHPTKGKQRSDETKNKIGDKRAKAWERMPIEQRQNFTEKARDKWNNMSVEQRDKLRKSSAKAVRAASSNGSKLEKFLFESLIASGFEVEFHREGLIANEKLQIDLFLPKNSIAIEVDGPTHYFPIWGEESLQKHLRADSEKNGLLNSKGFHVIRIKSLSKFTSQIRQRKLLNTLISKINELQTLNKPTIIEVEA